MWNNSLLGTWINIISERFLENIYIKKTTMFSIYFLSIFYLFSISYSFCAIAGQESLSNKRILVSTQHSAKPRTKHDAYLISHFIHVWRLQAYRKARNSPAGLNARVS